MNIVECSLPIQEVLPTLDQVIERMGYESGAIDQYFMDLADEELRQAASLVAPRGVQAELKIEIVSRNAGFFIAGGRRFFPGPRILARLAKAPCLIVFACTIGADIGLRVRSLVGKGASVEAFMLDSIAGLAADNVAEALQKNAEAEAERLGLGCTERFSPGYCGWPVSAQEALFSLLPPNPCGISLNASSMMIPEKSVSGIFGIGTGLSRQAYGCGSCDKEDCPVRRRMT